MISEKKYTIHVTLNLMINEISIINVIIQDYNSDCYFGIDGIKPVIFSNISLSPNPFDNRLKITFTDKIKVKQITIHNINGKEIYSQKINPSNTEINSNFMTPNLYFIKLINIDNSIINQKIIKY